MKNICRCGKPCKKTFCTQKCASFFRRSGEIKTCKNCENGFYVIRSSIKKGEGLFCNIKCKIEYKAKRSPWYEKKGKTAVHRIVMEEKIGRKLIKGETVHHIDGNKRNNNSENLILFKSHSEHMKHEFSCGKMSVSNGVKSGTSRRLKKKTLFI